MRSSIIPLAFVVTLAVMACSVPVQAGQPASPAITRSGAIEGAGAVGLQAALDRFYQSGMRGQQTLVLVTFSGDEKAPYSILSLHLVFTEGAALFRVGDAEVKNIARNQPQAIQAEILRLFKRERLYVIAVGTANTTDAALLWCSPDHDAFYQWMRKNVRGGKALEQAKL